MKDMVPYWVKESATHGLTILFIAGLLGFAASMGMWIYWGGWTP